MVRQFKKKTKMTFIKKPVGLKLKVHLFITIQSLLLKVYYLYIYIFVPLQSIFECELGVLFFYDALS